MPEYRDIGSINSVTGPMQEVGTERYTQVYQATHVGEKYLPYMNRSFISFSYGGKNIEDFNLIATIEGDRMQRDGYASFNNLTSDYSVLHGQYYWGTYYKTNLLVLKLATDEMTLLQLDEFVYWFSADAVRELILSEHPNRAIMARVQTPPQITMLPFEKKINILLGNESYKTSTTAYRGEIRLSFIMDDPHWYSKISIFGYLNSDGVYKDEWKDANGLTKRVFDDPDAIKVAHEDGIPFSTMIHDSMLLGDNTYANVDYSDYSRVATMRFSVDENIPYQTWVGIYLQEWDDGFYDNAENDANAAVNDLDLLEIYVKGAVIAADDAPNTPQTIRIASDTVFDNVDYIINTQYYNEELEEYIDVTIIYKEYILANTDITPGLVAGPAMTLDGGVLDLLSNPGGSLYPLNNAFIYYPGTAPSPTELTFTLTPSTANNYINCPNNSYALSEGITPFNTLVLEGEMKLALQFTTCGFHTAYNKAVEIFKSLGSSDYLSWVLVREAIRDLVRHKAVRAWVNKIIDFFDPNGDETGNDYKSPSVAISNGALTYLEYLLKDASGNFYPSTYTFNSKTGQATAELHYRNTNNNVPAANEWASYGTVNADIEPHVEDVGDMLKSNYLTIKEHNILDSTGSVSAWSQSNKKTSHRIYHNVYNGLKNITLTFKNMYL